MARTKQTARKNLTKTKVSRKSHANTRAISKNYDTMLVADLKKLVTTHGLTLTKGSGKNGSVVKADYIEALEAYDFKNNFLKSTADETPKVEIKEKDEKIETLGTIHVLTIFNEDTALSKDFARGFLKPSKTLAARSKKDLKLQFKYYLENCKYKVVVPDLDEKIKNAVSRMKYANPHLECAYITIYAKTR